MVQREREGDERHLAARLVQDAAGGESPRKHGYCHPRLMSVGVCVAAGTEQLPQHA